MKLVAFRIFNFRSIVDSGWVEFSPDNVTVLVGQNESGKTSVLSALHSVLGGANITPDDKRIGADDPYVLIRLRITLAEIEKSGYLSRASIAEKRALVRYLEQRGDVVELRLWRLAKAGSAILSERMHQLVDEAQYSEIYEEELSIHGNAVPASTDQPTAVEEASEVDEPLDAKAAAEILYDLMPWAVFFSADTGLLPNTVDIDDKGKPSGTGAIAASNFLSVAEIDLPSLVKGDGRYRENILNKANQRISENFGKFWSQVIGAASKLSLKCAFEHYGTSAGEKAGKPYLEFWIADGNTQLYPRQRSQGVTWFLSFFLQLRATEKSKDVRLFLLDEPGANLHEKAQEDVLRLVDELRADIAILYSTHSPKMIEYDKLFRIRAVQRNGEKEDSPTAIIDAHHLGAASSDTLSPLLNAMGADMSQQAVVKKRRNVILEEISGFYYLKAFWQLLDRKEEAHFIAATGVNKVPQIANMFLGWGLEYVVAVDDDKQGREVYNLLKKELCGDRDDFAKRLILKFPSCTAIEEVFSREDFSKFVVNTNSTHKAESNAEYMKSNKLSKPVTALNFKLHVESGQITLALLDQTTTANMKRIADAICEVLAAREAKA